MLNESNTMSNSHYLHKKQVIIKSAGFTLLEIGIALTVIGILIALMMPTFTSSIRDKARAYDVQQFVDKSFKNIRLIENECNLPVYRVVNYNNTATGADGQSILGSSIRDVLTQGAVAVTNATYKACFDRAKIRPLSVPKIAGAYAGFTEISAPTGGYTYMYFSTENPNLASEILKSMGIDSSTYTLSGGTTTVQNSKCTRIPLGVCMTYTVTSATQKTFNFTFKDNGY